MSKIVKNEKANLLERTLVLLMVLVIALAMMCSGWGNASMAKAAGKGSFTTNSFRVQINVNKDNSAYINEKITIDAGKKGVSTIERTLPAFSVIEYTDATGKLLKKVRNPIKIADVAVENDVFEIKRTPGKYKITIGRDNKKITGKKTYNLSYKVTMYEDTVKEADAFSYMALPDKWPTAIENAAITIIMPKKFDKTKVKAFTVKKRQSTESDMVSWKIRGKTIAMKVNEPLKAKTGIRAVISLPEGYFTGEKSTAFGRVLVVGLSIIAALLLLLLWYRFGRDNKKITTVRQEPPEDMTPPEAGYIMTGTVKSRDMVSMILWFADKGYLTIEENLGEYILTKQQDLPEDAKAYQKTFFDGLFAAGDGEKVTDKELHQEHPEYYKNAVEQLTEYFTKDRKRKVFPGKFTFQRVAALVLAGVAYAGLVILIAGLGFDMLGSILLLISLICLYVGAVMGITGQSYGKKRSRPWPLPISKNVCSVILLAISLILYLLVLVLREGYFIGGLAGCVFILAAYGTIRFMGGRTRYGAEALSQLLGFREYIKEADGEKLKEVVTDNPEYYSNVLPYAYVLGVPKKWSMAFRHIEGGELSWYQSSHGELKDADSWDVFRHLIKCTKTLVEALSVSDKKEAIPFGGLAKSKFKRKTETQEKDTEE